VKQSAGVAGKKQADNDLEKAMALSKAQYKKEIAKLDEYESYYSQSAYSNEESKVMSRPKKNGNEK